VRSPLVVRRRDRINPNFALPLQTVLSIPLTSSEPVPLEDGLER